MFQRDVFIDQIFEKLETDKSIYFLSSDFGAVSLDKLREKFPNNFIHCGISEQAMLDIATGLSLEGNKVFVYAMAPFLSLRAIEQSKCGPAMMNLPISIISVGIGLGYADAGPTHYANEDFACMRTLINNTIFTPSDEQTTKLIAKSLLNSPRFSYVRLDRDILPDLAEKITDEDMSNGFKIFGGISSEKIAIISHGKIFHECYEIYKNRSDLFCVNLFRSKPFPEELIKKLKEIRKILVVDEQTPGGNLGSCVYENFSNSNLFPQILTRCLDNKFIFENGGRKYLLAKYGLSIEDITNDLMRFK